MDKNIKTLENNIKTLEKHLEIAEKEATIAELENKIKQLDEEWAIEKFGQHGLYFEHILLTCLKDQDIELRTLKHEKQRIIDHRDQIIESYNHYHKELRAEKEKFEQEASKLKDLLVEKDEQIQQKDEEVSKLNDIAEEKDEQLKQKEKVFFSWPYPTSYI